MKLIERDLWFFAILGFDVIIKNCVYESRCLNHKSKWGRNKNDTVKFGRDTIHIDRIIELCFLLLDLSCDWNFFRRRIFGAPDRSENNVSETYLWASFSVSFAISTSPESPLTLGAEKDWLFSDSGAGRESEFWVWISSWSIGDVTRSVVSGEMTERADAPSPRKTLGPTYCSNFFEVMIAVSYHPGKPASDDCGHSLRIKYMSPNIWCSLIFVSIWILKMWSLWISLVLKNQSARENTRAYLLLKLLWSHDRCQPTSQETG